jgi:hypothetical protein
LRPGHTYRLFLSQSGKLRFKSLDLTLACDEETTYRQGTESRCESRRVWQGPVWRQEQFEILRGRPFEVQCDLQVPAWAMHSFKADHNELNWKLVVQGRLAGWPRYQREFPVIVYPADGSQEP